MISTIKYSSFILYALPNVLTGIRLIGSPIVVVLWLQQWQEMALIIFVCLGVFDYLDGFLARALRCESKLGAFLDPIADKVLIMSSFSVLLYTEVIMGGAVILSMILLVREVMVLYVRVFTDTELLVMRLSKVKTGVQMLTVGLFMTAYLLSMEWMMFLAWMSLWIAVFLTLVTGVQYLRRWV